MNYLGNAFSLQMLPAGATFADVYIARIEKEDIPMDRVICVIGHADLAHMLGFEMNRVNTKLQPGDTLYVAQYVGGRLPEGCHTLPEGAHIDFFKVYVTGYRYD